MKSYGVALLLTLVLNTFANANLPDVETMPEPTGEVSTPAAVPAKIGPMVRAAIWAFPVLSFISGVVHDGLYDKQQVPTILKWLFEDKGGELMIHALRTEWFFGRIDDKFLDDSAMLQLRVIAGFCLTTFGALRTIPGNAVGVVWWGADYIYATIQTALLYKTLEAIENPETQQVPPGLKTAHTLLAKLKTAAFIGFALKGLLHGRSIQTFLSLVSLSLDIHYINQAVALAEEHIAARVAAQQQKGKGDR